ncbi:NAD(P)-binding domain-containing protein [Nocardia sp. CA-135398]|uniref:NAD(P)-binding domain-containing protein n=1 Tax=Nocardia sp. CA-135398 TaxID=3239977 RepID=UPI003D9803C9
MDCSTISTESWAAIRGACELGGVGFLAAPASGNAKVVASGGLSIAASGPSRSTNASRHHYFCARIRSVRGAATRRADATRGGHRTLGQASVGSSRVLEDFAILFDLQAENSGLVLKPENDGLGGD